MAKRNYTQMQSLEVYKLVADGKLKKFPDNYLDKDIIMEILRHIVLKINKFTREETIKKVDYAFLKANYIGGFRNFFDGSIPTMLIKCFPEWELKRWEFRKVNNGFWKDKKNQKEFILWLAKKEKLDLTKKEDVQKISAEMVYSYAGSKALAHSGGLFELVNSVLNDRFQEWELYKSRTWTQDRVITATKWLVEEKLKLTPEQVCKLKVEDFYANDLGGMLLKGCDHSILKALDMTYPGAYERKADKGISLKQK